MTESDEKDLPLMANVTEILVDHYSLDLACNFNKRCFSGSATIFLRPIPNEKKNVCLCSKDCTINNINCCNNTSFKGTTLSILNGKEQTTNVIQPIQDKNSDLNLKFNECSSSVEDQSSKKREHFDDRNSETYNNPPLCSEEEAAQNFGCFAYKNLSDCCYTKPLHTDKPTQMHINKHDTEFHDHSTFSEGKRSLESEHTKEENSNINLNITGNGLLSKDHNPESHDHFTFSEGKLPLESEHTKKENSNINSKTTDIGSLSTDQTTNNTNQKSADIAEDTGFVVLLDCHQITVKEVVDVATQQKLHFSVSLWALKVWKDNRTCRFCFPRVIKVIYETLSSSPSLLWVKDQTGRPAVFTFGAYVNNRSLLPCQEPPIAMATWEAVLTVTDTATVLMSGDEEPVVKAIEGGMKQYHFHCKKPLPMSTLCLAVGFWEEYAIPTDLQLGCKCRLFACPNMLDKSIKELLEYIPQCIVEAEKVLGPYPFPRIDFLIVPPTFGSLGMASPNVVFLSQSLLSGGGMLSRVSHEVSHGWFGLSIGALDWTEEWISEGFATFMEDVLHTRVAKMSMPDAKDLLELKTFLRKQMLCYEIENTNQELQVLRPSFGNTNTDIIDGVNATILKNGRDPEKNFMQVHYIKGYFLLNYLSNIIGLDCFLECLKGYVKAFEGKLVTSQEFFAFLFDTSAELKRHLTIESIYENWLHNPGMPLEIENFKPSCNNKLTLQVAEETNKWKKLNAEFIEKKAKRKKLDPENFSTLMPEQTVLLLENLLEEEILSGHTLTLLKQVLHLKDANAEVQHRWFELVVKYRLKSEYSALEDFLRNHLALGVYLYGEAIHSGGVGLKKLAKKIFLSLKYEMEPNYRDTIQAMLDTESDFSFQE
ncbi:hypothetical protein JTE90_013010 [Oedothorax gibbosus]|uniref:Peptidase M1 leukotriene A4 hydrolase/aminopeptidase C-terminal domain-containing protein n=1 Tax=Oedothorax gibbosus TaxID=931172 RepID=A0AAV6UNN2_9ARAC|nr:hypothetical protein JTE90_013010 [Oedothorax gibbosus]